MSPRPDPRAPTDPDAAPIPLAYRPPTAGPPLGHLVPTMLAATACFATAHFALEILTWRLAAFHFHWLGPVSDPYQRSKLEDRYSNDMMIEFVWLIPATTVLFLAQLGLSAFCRDASRPRTPAMGLLVGAVYCWARWGLWGLSKAVPFPYPEPADFLLSMLLAAVGGAALAAWRRTGTIANAPP